MADEQEEALNGEIFEPGEPIPGVKAIHHATVFRVKSKQKMERFDPWRKFYSTEELFWAIVEYFEWARENPMVTDKPMSVSVGNGGGTEIVQSNTYHDRPFTVGGMLVYIGVSPTTWKEWQDPDNANHWPRAKPVIEWAKTIIADQKYQGALIGAYNPMIVARDLGLVDRAEVKTENTNVNITEKMSIDPKDLTYSERKAILDALDKKRAEKAKRIEPDDDDIDDLLG